MKFSLILAALLSLPLTTFAADGLVATEDTYFEMDVPFSQSSVKVSLHKAEAQNEEQKEEQEVGKVYKPKVLYFTGAALLSPTHTSIHGQLAASAKFDGSFSPQYRRANAIGDIVELEAKDGVARVRITLGEPTKASLDLYGASQISAVYLPHNILHGGEIKTSVQLITAFGSALAL